jgi:chromosome segregation protein
VSTQFLIITHKRKVMAIADQLYGVTMQESGVSKVLSMRLGDEIEED